MHASDLNADGLRDAIAVSLDSLWVSAFLQAPAGGLGEAIDSQLREPCWDAALGDFDEDGRPDFAVPGIYSGFLFLHRGNGDGSFTYERLYRPEASVPIAIAEGDVNGDSHVDLAVANWSAPGLVSVLLGAGDGSFPTEIDFETNSGPTDIELGDLNHDGNLDAVVSYRGFNAEPFDSVAVHLGNGDGTFSSGVSVGAGRLPFHVAIGELNDDGRPDLAVVSFDGMLSVLLGEGDGRFAPPIRYPVGTRPRFVAIGDLDGDGWNDIAITDPEDSARSDSVALFINNQDGSFSGPSYEFAGVESWGLVLEDFTGDGRLDASIASRREDKVSFLRNCGSCIPTAAELALLEAYADARGVHLRWYVSESLGSWATVERRTTVTDWEVRRGPTPIEGAGVDFDDLDAAPGGTYAYRLTVLGSDHSTTTPEVWVAVPGDPVPEAVTIGLPTPNPMSHSVNIRVSLPRSATTDLLIFDVAGRVVRRLHLEGRAGWQSLLWDGNDQSGRALASGTYFLRLNGRAAPSRRLVLLR